MQLKITKDALLNTMERVSAVANKGVMTEYDKKDRVTIIVTENKVTFKTSNGHMFLVTSIPQGGVKGQATVTASTMLNIIRAIKTDALTAPLLIEKDGDMLRISDPSSKKNKIARLQVFASDFDFGIKRPSKGHTYPFDPGMLLRAIDRVSPFVSKLGYRIAYQMMLIHMFKEQVRFICGDGGCFALFDYKPTNVQYELVDAVAGDQYLLPVNQALILRTLLAGAVGRVEFTWSDKNEVFIQEVDDKGEPVGPDQIQIKGIPNEPYIEYADPAYQMDNAKAVLDISTTKLSEGLNLVAAVKDKEIQESEREFLGFDFTASEGNLNLTVAEGKYRCDVDVDAEFIPVDGFDRYKSYYPFDYVSRICRTCTTPTLRFYCINENGVMNAEAVETSPTEKDEHGFPVRLTGDALGDPRFHWFFASAKDETEVE